MCRVIGLLLFMPSVVTVEKHACCDIHPNNSTKASLNCNSLDLLLLFEIVMVGDKLLVMFA